LRYIDRAEHSPLATRFGQDVGVVILSIRSWALRILGYPDAALTDAERAVKNAREVGHVPTLMYALYFDWTSIYRGDYAEANARAEELIALADEKGALFWTAFGTMKQACVLTLTGKASDAIQMFTAQIAAYRFSSHSVWYIPRDILRGIAAAVPLKRRLSEF
jgi:hypothetical protein